MTSEWKLRLRLVAQRFWQPTGACMTVMPGTWLAGWNPSHWAVALQTGLATAFLAFLLSLTPARKLYYDRWGNAAVVAILTVLGDLWSHGRDYGFPYWEALVTGVVAGLLALAAWWLFEDRARRVRAAWRRLVARGRP